MAGKRTSRPITILLVDDHLEMGYSLEDILALEPDFRVIGVARTGLEGVTLALKLRPDVILMNDSAPGMNGIEATSRIIRRSPDAIVILVAGYDDPQLIDAAFKAGARGYFVKPIAVFEELYATIRLASEQRQARAALNRWARAKEKLSSISKLRKEA